MLRLRRRAWLTTSGVALVTLSACGPKPQPKQNAPAPHCPASVEPGVTFGAEGPSKDEMARSREPYFHFERSLHSEDQEVLRHPDSLTLVRLEPEGWSGVGAFHGCQTMKRATTNTPRVFEWVSHAIETSDGSTMLCFTPHHGISARRGDKTVELLVCFMCRQMYVYSDHPRLVPISEDSADMLEATFRAAGL